jgi:hypothetical protein
LQKASAANTGAGINATIAIRNGVRGRMVEQGVATDAVEVTGVVECPLPI